MGNADNQFLWRPRAAGPIYIRFTFSLPGDTTTHRFTRSLGTRSYDEERRIRNRSFLPLIALLSSAQTAYEFANQVVKTAASIIDRDLSSFLERLEPDVDGTRSASTVAAPSSRPRRTGIKWGELSKKYLDHIRVKDSNGRSRRSDATVMKYTGEVGVIDAFFGKGTLVSDMSRRKVASFLEHMEAQGKHADTTINFYMDRIGAIFRFGIARGLFDSNTAIGIRIEGAKQKAGTAFTREEADAAVALAPPKSKIFEPSTFTAFSMIARYTGARLGEIAALEAGDVIDVRGVRCLRMLTEKSNCRGGRSESVEHRFVPVAAKLACIIDACLERRPSGLLFPKTGTWKWKKAHAFGKAYNRAVKIVAPKCSFHSWRHYAVSEMMNAGIQREIRLKLVGHKDDSVHGGYTHARIQSMLEAVSIIY